MKKHIFAKLLGIIGITLLLITFYKSEIISKGSLRGYYLYFYIFVVIFIFTGIADIFLRKEKKVYLRIIFFSSIISLYLFEFYLSFNIAKNIEINEKSKIYFNSTGKQFEKRSKYEFFLSKKKKNPDVKFFIQPDNFLYYDNLSIFPLSGKSNSETIFCNENGYYSTYLSDRYGFNNEDIIWDKSKVDYLLIGDSFVHGACVNSKDNFAGNLKALTKKNVINLGYGGNGPLINLATLIEYLPSQKVDKILWFYFEENDLQELNLEIRNSILKNYLDNRSFSQNLKVKQSLIDKYSENLMKIKIENKNFDKKIFNESLSYKLLELIKSVKNIAILYEFRKKFFLRKKNDIENKDKSYSNNIDELTEILKIANYIAENKGAKLYFIYLPGFWRYSSDVNLRSYNLVKESVQNLNIEFIDIHESFFKKQTDPLKFFPFRKFGHYNEEGYSQVSKKIFQLIKGSSN